MWHLLKIHSYCLPQDCHHDFRSTLWSRWWTTWTAVGKKSLRNCIEGFGIRIKCLLWCSLPSPAAWENGEPLLTWCQVNQVQVSYRVTHTSLLPLKTGPSLWFLCSPHGWRVLMQTAGPAVASSIPTTPSHGCPLSLKFSAWSETIWLSPAGSPPPCWQVWVP